MLRPPQAAQGVFAALAGAFTRLIASRMSALARIAMRTLGRRTLTQILITAAGRLEGHDSTYSRLFSRPAWLSWKLTHLLARLLIDLEPMDEPIVVPSVRWVYVEDHQGTHRPEYFFSTDPAMPLERIVGLYTRRWNIETLSQEVREHVGPGNTRRRRPKAVQRAESWHFGLYSVIVLIYVEHRNTHTPSVPSWPWRQKREPLYCPQCGGEVARFPVGPGGKSASRRSPTRWPRCGR